MEEYILGLLIIQTGEQIDKFKDKVPVPVNAVQILRHRRLATDLLTPGQMAI
jgi:hypothetical protein